MYIGICCVLLRLSATIQPVWESPQTVEGLWCSSFHPQWLTWPTQQQLRSSLVAHEQRPADRENCCWWVGVRAVARGVGQTCGAVSNVPLFEENKAPPCGCSHGWADSTLRCHKLHSTVCAGFSSFTWSQRSDFGLKATLLTSCSAE